MYKQIHVNISMFEVDEDEAAKHAANLRFGTSVIQKRILTSCCWKMSKSTWQVSDESKTSKASNIPVYIVVYGSGRFQVTTWPIKMAGKIPFEFADNSHTTQSVDRRTTMYRDLFGGSEFHSLILWAKIGVRDNNTINILSALFGSKMAENNDVLVMTREKTRSTSAEFQPTLILRIRRLLIRCTTAYLSACHCVVIFKGLIRF